MTWQAVFENPRVREYRGWKIEPQESTQLGYDLSSGHVYRRGKGRKTRGYILHGPDGATKFVETLAHAHSYIDEYMGPVG